VQEIPIAFGDTESVPLAFRGLVLDEISQVVKAAKLGHVFPLHGNRLRFILPWIGNLVFKLRSDLSWSLTLPAILSRDSAVRSMQIYGTHLASDFPKLFLSFLSRLTLFWKLIQLRRECDRYSLKIDLERGMEFFLQMRIAAGDAGHISIGNMQDGRSGLSGFSSVSRCFPLIRAVPARNSVLARFLAVLLGLKDKSEDIGFPNYAQCTKSIATLSSEMHGEFWSLFTPSFGVRLFLIFSRKLTLNLHMD
jgi:hypothetical protein